MATGRTQAERRLILCIGLVVAVGLGLRSYHYARGPSLWHDEGAVVVNVLDKTFMGLLGRLEFANPSPPLFLWIEKIVCLTINESTYAWRLVPFLASCAALALMVPVARRVLSLGGTAWALFLFACSDRLLWHSCEAKPYAVDVLCTTALLAVYCWTRSWPAARQLLLYTALAPVLIFLSYPGTFLCGGLLMALLPAAWRDRGVGTWLAYGAFALVVLACFSALVVGPIRAQRCNELLAYWTRQFPNWSLPWRVPLWTIKATFEMLRYCIKPTGGMLAVVTAIGGVSLWRRGQEQLVLLLTVPVALAVCAAYLGYYPYGHSRTEAYVVPAVVLLTAAGIAPTWLWLRARAQLAPVLLMPLLLAPLALTLYRLAVPWDRPDSEHAAAYVLAHRQPTDAVNGSHWEHEVLFRQLGALFSLGVNGARGWQERLWIVSEGPTRDARLRPIREHLPDDWAIVEQNEDYAFTSVVLLAKKKHGQ